MLTLVVARARNGAIGRGNTIPWHIPEDLKLFQRETMGGAVIMGRNTWDSLPFKPLKGRMNIVVTSRPLEGPEVVTATIGAALRAATAAGHARLYGIGGAGIYRAMLPLADRLLVSEVDLDVPDADTFFPAFTESDWREMPPMRLNRGAPACSLREFLRRG